MVNKIKKESKSKREKTSSRKVERVSNLMAHKLKRRDF